jgi:hypothetical protein
MTGYGSLYNNLTKDSGSSRRQFDLRELDSPLSDPSILVLKGDDQVKLVGLKKGVKIGKRFRR